MILFTFTMRMIGCNDIIICPSKVCPPCVQFDIGSQKDLPVMVNRSFNDFINDTHINVPVLTVLSYVFHISPGRANVYCFPVTRRSDVFAAVFYHLKPASFCFGITGVAFNDIPNARFQQNTKVFLCIIPGIHTDQKGVFR